MKRTLILLVAVLVFEAARVANAGRVTDAWKPPSSDRFDFMSRCSNPRLLPDDRIRYCKQVVGSGGGVQGDNAALLLIGKAYRDEKDYAQALATFDMVLVREPDIESHRWLVPDIADVYAERGVTRALAGQFEPAMKDAEKVMQLMPDEAGSFNNRCWTRALAGKELETAIADCDEALKRHPKFAEAFDSRGFVNFKLGKLQAALDDYNNALRLENRMWSSLYMKGLIEKRLNDPSGETDMARAVKENPNLSAVFAAYGVNP